MRFVVLFCEKYLKDDQSTKKLEIFVTVQSTV